MKRELATSIIASRSPRHAVRKVVASGGSKVLTKYGSKAAAKTLTKTAANPGFLLADGLEMGTEFICRKAGCSDEDARFYGGSVGLGTSVGVGAAIGGPVGGVIGAGLWGVGKLFQSLFD